MKSGEDDFLVFLEILHFGIFSDLASWFRHDLNQERQSIAFSFLLGLPEEVTTSLDRVESEAVWKGVTMQGISSCRFSLRSLGGCSIIHMTGFITPLSLRITHPTSLT